MDLTQLLVDVLFHLELFIFHYSILGQTADQVVRGLHIRVSSWVPSSMDLTPFSFGIVFRGLQVAHIPTQPGCIAE